MSYLDENGKILIDDVAAKGDIKKLIEAKAKLEVALGSLSTITTLNSELSGPTATAISETTMVLKSYIETQITNINTTIENINGTVNKYKTIDSDLSSKILAT